MSYESCHGTRFGNEGADPASPPLPQGRAYFLPGLSTRGGNRVEARKNRRDILFVGRVGRYGHARVNRESVERLLVTGYPGLLSLLRRKARDPQLAADLLNEAIVVALNNFDSGRVGDPSNIGGYVFQVAMNLLRNHRRSYAGSASRRAEASEENLAGFAVAGEVEDDWAQRVRKLIDSLPTPRDRAIIKRFYLDEEDKSSICSELKVTSLQFDQIIFRARKRLLQIFESSGLRRTDFLSFLFGGMLLGLATDT